MQTKCLDKKDKKKLIQATKVQLLIKTKFFFKFFNVAKSFYTQESAGWGSFGPLLTDYVINPERLIENKIWINSVFIFQASIYDKNLYTKA